jgi:hypothetical protein
MQPKQNTPRENRAMAKCLSVHRELRYHPMARNLLLGLEVVEEDRSLLRLLTPILNDNA